MYNDPSAVIPPSVFALAALFLYTLKLLSSSLFHLEPICSTDWSKQNKVITFVYSSHNFPKIGPDLAKFASKDSDKVILLGQQIIRASKDHKNIMCFPKKL